MSKSHRQLVFWPECHEPNPSIKQSKPQPWRCVLTFEQIGLLLLAVMGLTVVSFCFGVATGERKVLVALRQRQASKAVSRVKKARGKKNVPEPKADARMVRLSDTTSKSKLAEMGSESTRQQEIVRQSDKTKTSNQPQPAAVLSEGTAPEKTVDKIYTIQVASFKRLKSAKKEAEELQRRGFEVKVLPKGNYKIVCVGEFKEKQEAASFKKKLPSRYKDSLIRSL